MDIKDCIYRFIDVPDVCKKIIDTPEFQKLRRVKQTGVACGTYPTVTHTRFEHSLGVMHLAGLAYKHITNNSNIKARDEMRIAMMTAGLCHDIGHGAFSHMLDDILEGLNYEYADHEERGVAIFRKINKQLSLFDSLFEELIVNMILGKVPPEAREWKYAWIYQVVHNRVSEVDVDKLDYLQRDSYHCGLPSFQPDYIIRRMVVTSNGDLGFKRKARDDIEKMFITRKSLFSEVYYHKTTIKINCIYKGAIELMTRSMGPDEVLYALDDDYRAENMLREKLPDVFAALDSRQLDKALELVGCDALPRPIPCYISGCNDLKKVMEKVPLV